MKPREIEGDILLVLQETLGALHLPENSSILAKKSTRIESTLKSYRISVEWPSDGDYSNLDILDEKYDLIFDPELPQTIIATKPCLLRCEDVLLKGELLIKRQ